MTEVSPFPWWLTLTFAICGAIGSLVGVVIGHLLTRSWQRTQWLLDNRRGEYREVIKAMTAALGPIIQCVKPGLVVTDKEQFESLAAKNLTYETIESRIFIHKDLEAIDLYARWVTLIAAFERHRDDRKFAQDFKELLDEIRTSAVKSVKAG